MAQNASGIRAARPTINLGGQNDIDLTQALLSLRVVENAHGLYRCEAVFGNWGEVERRVDFLYFDRQKLDFGKVLRVQVEDQTIFEGRITALEAHYPSGQPPQLGVLAEDRLQDLRMTRRTRTFSDMTDQAVLSQIAQEHGLSAEVQVNGPTHPVLAQVNQSDLAFLRERARMLDAEVWVAGSTLCAQHPTARNSPPCRLHYQAELIEFSVAADLAHQRTSVAVNGWEVASKTGIQYEATDQILGGELGNDQSGAAILATALGPRKEALAHTVPLTTTEAQTEAEAVFRLLARRFVVGRGVAEPTPELQVGRRVELFGLGPLFSGKYQLTEVVHAFDGRHGLRTTFTAERAGLGRA